MVIIIITTTAKTRITIAIIMITIVTTIATTKIIGRIKI